MGLAVTSAILIALSQLGKIDAQPENPASTAVNANTTPIPVATSTVAAKEKDEASAPMLPEDLSPGMAEIIKLAQAHVSDEVLLAYIKNSSMQYAPSADEIVYLSDLGISDNVMTELIQHGKSVGEIAKNSAPAQSIASSPAPAANPPAPSYTVAAEAPAPEVPAPAAPPQQVTVNYFYDSLAPYGTWVEVPDYGRCWRPTVVSVNPNWRPYCDRGRWVYTDAGWYWQSDYSWGWAPFHYGRWQNDLRFGWVWMPDNVWGPSWVSWRHAGAYCGWAPLPPSARFEVGIGLVFNHGHVGVGFDFGLRESCFTFVSYDHFCDRNIYAHVVPRHQVTTIYNHSTVINNYTVVNKTVVNEGIGRDRVAAITHKQVEKITLRDVPASHVAGTKSINRVDKNTKSLGVFRPAASVIAAPLAKPHVGSVSINQTSHTTVSTTTPQHSVPAHPNAESVKSTTAISHGATVHENAIERTSVTRIETPSANTRPAKLNEHPSTQTSPSTREATTIPSPATHHSSSAISPATPASAASSSVHQVWPGNNPSYSPKAESIHPSAHAETYPYGHRTVEQQNNSPRVTGGNSPSYNSSPAPSGSGHYSTPAATSRPPTSSRVAPASSAPRQERSAPERSSKSDKSGF